MYELIYHDVFKAWFKKLKKRDSTSHMRISERLKQIEKDGFFGDKKYVGGGVWELRFQWGAGYRAYYTQRGAEVVFLLCGGDKSGQENDIKYAKKLSKEGWGCGKTYQR